MSTVVALGVVGMTSMAPMFFYEVGSGLWLLIKGLPVPAVQGLSERTGGSQ